MIMEMLLKLMRIIIRMKKQKVLKIVIIHVNNVQGNPTENNHNCITCKEDYYKQIVPGQEENNLTICYKNTEILMVIIMIKMFI